MVRPHYVTVAKNGKVTCSDCPGWNAYKICSHSLAVAEKSGRTARRKGGRNSNKAAPTMVTDRVTAPADVSTATSRTVPIPLFRTNVVDVLSPAPRQSTSTNPPSLQPTQVSTNPPFQHAPHANPLFGPVFQNNMQPLSETPRSMIYSFPSTRPSSNPSQSDFRIQLLQLCSPLVRSCYGCSQTLKPGGMIASPPNDMVIMSRMNREYPDINTGEMRQKEGNVYFHMNVCCIRRKQAYFSPQMATLSEDIVLYLTPYLHCLREFGLSACAILDTVRRFVNIYGVLVTY